MPVSDAPDTSDYASPLEKVFMLLHLLATKDARMSLGDLALEMGIPKTTLHRITRQLEDLGYLQKDLRSRHLVHSNRLVELAVDILRSSVVQAERHAILRDLSDELGESCCIGTRVGHEIVYLDDVTASTALTMQFRTGAHAPLHCTSQGKIQLAHMSEKEWQRYVDSETLEKFTDFTITDFDQLAELVRQPERRQFASSDREYHDGLVGAAAAVIGPRNKLYAAVSFAAPSARMSMQEVHAARPTLERAAARFAATLTP